MRLSRLWATLCLILSATYAHADEKSTNPPLVPSPPSPNAAPLPENNDIDLIPPALQAPAAPSSSPPSAPGPVVGSGQRIYLENAAAVSSLRDNLLVPQPPPEPFNWQERLFLDAHLQWSPASNLDLAYSGRFNFQAQDNVPFPGRENVRNDFREAYASWEPVANTYLEAGRINLKSGSAVGFNPTDYFKTRAVVDPLSLDPETLREDRLGTVMVRAQQITEGAAFTAAFAPAIYRATQVYTSTNLPSFNPMFDRTNAHDRLLLKASGKIVADLSPEVLLYREGNRIQYGANIAENVGQAVVLYAEWSGGKRSSLIDQALTYGRQTGTLPSNAPSVLPVDSDTHFQNDLAVGGSYTSSGKITYNLEYHFHEAGFSRRDWDNWFRTGEGNVNSPAVTGELWFIRAYAAEQQEPLLEHYVFLRADWVDAFVRNLELTGFVDFDLLDGSALTQVTADYYLSNTWTVGGLVQTDLGRRRSEFGSLPQAASVFLRLVHYF